MTPEIEGFFKEFVRIKRQINTLKARSQELVFVLLPEVESGSPLTVDGARVYKLEARDSRRLDKDLLRAQLVERLGEHVAELVIQSSTVTTNASFPTVAVRLLAEEGEAQGEEVT